MVEIKYFMNTACCTLVDALDKYKLPIVGYTFHVGDLFHPGHLHQLKESKRYCDVLICGILTDGAVESYKRTPILSCLERMNVYTGIKYVDRVVSQADRDPTENLKVYKPDVLFHGNDWGEIPGSEWMKANGGKVIKTPYYEGICTTDIISRIKNDL